MGGDCPYLYKKPENNDYYCKKNFRMNNNGETRLDDIEILNLYCKEYNYIGCPFYSFRIEKEGCFLTTAMCNILGKEDDCYELETLRKFRDNILKKTSYGKAIVEEYYKIAPGISVKLINHNDKESIALYMNNHYIIPIIVLINHKNYDSAINMYIEMVEYIKSAIK